MVGPGFNFAGKQEMGEHVNIFFQNDQVKPYSKGFPRGTADGAGGGTDKACPLSPVLAPFCASNHKDLYSCCKYTPVFLFHGALVGFLVSPVCIMCNFALKFYKLMIVV